MPDFTIRIEMHGAEWEEHDALRMEMESAGFAATVRGSGGASYALPAGEYVCAGEMTRQQVLARARQAAARGGFGGAILVTESAGRAWSGLDPAPADSAIGIPSSPRSR